MAEQLASLLKLGLDHLREGRLEEAVAAWQEVLRQDPGNRRAKMFLDDALSGAFSLQIHDGAEVEQAPVLSRSAQADGESRKRFPSYEAGLSNEGAETWSGAWGAGDGLHQGGAAWPDFDSAPQSEDAAATSADGMAGEGGPHRWRELAENSDELDESAQDETTEDFLTEVAEADHFEFLDIQTSELRQERTSDEVEHEAEDEGLLFDFDEMESGPYSGPAPSSSPASSPENDGELQAAELSIDLDFTKSWGLDGSATSSTKADSTSDFEAGPAFSPSSPSSQPPENLPFDLGHFEIVHPGEAEAESGGDAAEAIFRSSDGPGADLSELEARLGGRHSVLKLNLPVEDLVWKKLDQTQGFLVSLLDGSSCLDDLFALSHLSELETARLLVELVDSEIIRVER